MPPACFKVGQGLFIYFIQSWAHLQGQQVGGAAQQGPGSCGSNHRARVHSAQHRTLCSKPLQRSALHAGCSCLNMVHCLDAAGPANDPHKHCRSNLLHSAARYRNSTSPSRRPIGSIYTPTNCAALSRWVVSGPRFTAHPSACASAWDAGRLLGAHWCLSFGSAGKWDAVVHVHAGRALVADISYMISRDLSRQREAWGHWRAMHTCERAHTP